MSWRPSTWKWTGSGDILSLYWCLCCLYGPPNGLYGKFTMYFMRGYTALQSSEETDSYIVKRKRFFKDLHSISNQMARALCVLEIGAGPGSNFQYLPKGTNIMCLDPNPYFERHLKKNSFHYPDVNLQEFLVGRAGRFIYPSERLCWCCHIHISSLQCPRCRAMLSWSEKSAPSSKY